MHQTVVTVVCVKCENQTNVISQLVSLLVMTASFVLHRKTQILYKSGIHINKLHNFSSDYSMKKIHLVKDNSHSGFIKDTSRRLRKLRTPTEGEIKK